MSFSSADVPVQAQLMSSAEPVGCDQAIPSEGYILSLLGRLDSEGIRYCHWKSNIRLKDTLEGREDVDLLVDRRDALPFLAALGEHGFKLAKSRFGTGHPGVFHALGLDESLGEIVDVHTYHLVLSGDSFVKNYRFPVAVSLLEGRRPLLRVPVPQPEAELVLFVLRIALKSIAPVEILKLNIHYDKNRKELDWLRSRADPRQAAALCTSWFPTISESLFRDAEQAVANERALGRRFIVGMRLSWQLRHLRRLGPVASVSSHVGRLTAFTLTRIQKRRELVPQSGGLIVALVGPKATGKSTISRALVQRLGKHLDVVHIHAGKPPATLLSAIPRLFVPAARRFLPHERLGEYEKPERRQEKQYSLIYVLRMTLLAYDRRKLLRRAMRLATRGAIVISDRYPTDKAGAIDSSCFDDEAVARVGSGLKGRLMNWERKLYRDVRKPDLVLHLQAPLEVALERDQQRDKQGGPNAESVRRRWSLENDVNFSGVPVVSINTGQGVEETTLAAMKAVWGVM